tara:strand:+ start:127 stop:882 length:756 start_codon:yes stop_codon:yes gene_type:complete
VDIKPHLSQYWLNPTIDDPEAFSSNVIEICDLYRQAPDLLLQGIHVISVDEMTGIQALERKYKTKTTLRGLIERREFEYIRHGTLCLIANWDVAQGRIIAPTIGPTRTEVDFAAHLRQTIATEPEAQWIFVMDQLNTHKSEALVRLVAELCGIKDDLGKKGKTGVLKTMGSRATFLKDPTHRIRIVYTPKHCSWMNQIEIWFSILMRRVLNRGNFNSKRDLESKITAFIEYFNKTMAKPFRWTYEGKALAA